MFDIELGIRWIKKHVALRDILILGFLLLLFVATRTYHIKQLPIFNDEGIYIHWAKVAWHDASWRFVSLTDGKQPLQTWGTIPFLKFFPDDALLAGRLFSVATGAFALLGMTAVLWYLFGKKTALMGSLLYIFIPYFLFYDRLAMVDSGVNAFSIWMFFFSILLVRTIRLDVALVFGLLSGLALLAKSSVRMFLALSALAPLVVISKDMKHLLRKTVNYLVLFGVVSLLALVVYNVQRLSPFFHFVAEKNNTFVMSFAEWRTKPLEVLSYNLRTVPYFVFAELGWAIVPFAMLGIVRLIMRKRPLGLYLLMWIVAPYIVISFFTKVLFARYIEFFGSLLVFAAAYWLGSLKNTKLAWTFLGAVIVSTLLFTVPMWTDYSKIIFPPTDRGQYIEGVTVGYGAREIIEYVREQSKSKPSIILAEGDFGMTGDILDVFLKQDDRIFIKGYWPLDEKQLRDNQRELARNNVYVVISHRLEVPANWPARLVKSYYKPGGNAAIHLMELTLQ